jgi:hypothetical protein
MPLPLTPGGSQRLQNAFFHGVKRRSAWQLAHGTGEMDKSCVNLLHDDLT